MSTVRIERTHDYWDCETCGSSFAEGADIYLDGVLVRQLVPVADCTDPTRFSEDDVMAAVLEILGHLLDVKVAPVLDDDISF